MEPAELNVTANGKESGTTVKAMPYDLIRNGVVDVNDFIAFATVFGRSTDSIDPSDAKYTHTQLSDYDGNGVVDIKDFIDFAKHYGAKKENNASSQNSDPVPSGALALLFNGSANEEQVYEEPEEIQPSVVQPQVSVETVVTVQTSTPEYLPSAQAAQSPSVQTLREVHSSALLDLYENQNELEPVDELSAPAIDEAIYQNDEFDFLFDDLESDADDASNVDLSVVLDELELELI